MHGKDISLSKALSWILRHGAIKEGLIITEEGFVAVDEILKHKSFRNYQLSDIQRVVAENEKQRFALRTDTETGILYIRANQGHSIQAIQKLDLDPILEASEAPVVIHGTYKKYWEKIKHEGLSHMSRMHIHFAPGDPGKEEVISGMRKSADLYIYIDMPKALADGLKFYRSLNNVILSPGNENGLILPKYFSKVADKHGRELQK